MKRLAIFLLLFTAALAQQPTVDEAHVRAHMAFLASDAMQGRGSGTEFEHLAAEYVGSEFQQYGLQPGGDTEDGRATFVQTAHLKKKTFTDAPVLKSGNSQWAHGKDMAVIRAGSSEAKGQLQRFEKGKPLAPGAAALVHLGEGQQDGSVRDQMSAPLAAGAALVLVADSTQLQQRYKAASSELPELRDGLGRSVIIFLGPEATKQIEALPAGAEITFSGATGEKDGGTTWNAIGVLPGSDPKAGIVLLSAHLDHLGANPALKGDQIYNGADDDASGSTAVMELARLLGQGAKPKRTVYFICYGSEELGGLGSQYFEQHLPFPLAKLVTNIEFEMIGRPDPKVKPDELWMAGFDRSNLGRELAAHGAKLVNDPHPEQMFFQRSDNYGLVKMGVVAHSISSFGLHAQYHKPDDDIAHIDFTHMTQAIASLVKPLRWLVDSSFVPQWEPGKKP